MSADSPIGERTLESAPWWGVLYGYAVHVFVGTLIFLVTYLPAVGIFLLIERLSSLGLDPLILVLRLGEYLLLAADSILFTTFIAKTTWRTARRL